MNRTLEIVCLAFAAALVFSLLSAAPAYAGAGNNTTQLQLNISATCGLIVNTSSISFGNLTTGETSTERGLLFSNIGSTTASLTINGTAWLKNDDPTKSFGSNYTHWDTTQGFVYGDGDGVNMAATGMGFTLANNASQSIYFRVQIPSGQLTGRYNQTVVIISTC